MAAEPTEARRKPPQAARRGDAGPALQQARGRL